jgi:hypothetical protein
MPLDRRRRALRWAAAALAAVTIGAASGCHKPPSAETRSFYMGLSDTDSATLLGCYQSDKNGRMTLFFGAPTTVNGAYGATLWSAPNLTVSQIGERVKSFVRGYAYCRQDSSFRILVGIGTSNAAIDGKTDSWLRAHGAAWSRMVESVAAWTNQYHPGQARIYGAWDVEPSWSTFHKADQWMHGYDGNAGRANLYTNSSADGCSTTSYANAACNNGWDQSDVWHLSWQHDPSLPIPQIYNTSGSQARQWQLIDLYGTVHRGDGVFYFGSTTQHGACQQVGGCGGTDNTPHEGSDQLHWYLQSDDRSKQTRPDAMTDMRWYS